MAECLAVLSPANEQRVAETVGLPDLIRGFENVKLRNVSDYRSAVAAAMFELRESSRVG
mgnify:CR=1 FL=1